MDKAKEQLEHINTVETQEQTPDVSVDKKRELEVNSATENTEIRLADLKKKIEIIKTSDHYSDEIKKQAEQIEKDLDNSSPDENILNEKA